VAAFSSADFYDAYRVDPDVVLLVQTLSFAFLGYALVGAAVLVGSASIAALRSRLLPRWLAVCGLVIAAVCAFGEWALFVPVPLLLLLLWLLATSVVLVARGRRDGAPEADGAVWDREQPA
jgi:heme A synthase